MKLDPVKQFVALRAALVNEKARLEARLVEINRALNQTTRAVSAPATAGKTSRQRARNQMSLKEAVIRVTKGKPLTKPEILDAIGKIGYRFAAKDPTNSLNVTLYTKGNFKNKDGRFSPLKS
jgi:hypothetical protein